MKHLRFYAVLFVLLGVVTFGAQTQNPQPPPPQQPPPTADPYANNANAGTLQFPLAAPAGRDSNARNVAPAGAVNQGVFNTANWKYGPAFDPPAGSQIWNPVKLKMKQGGKVTGGTVFSATDPATYCAMANAGYDFIWTEMQHNDRDWGSRGADVAHLSERDRGAGRARRLHRRARNPARARRRRAGRRRSDGRHRRRSHRGAQLDLLPAARQAQQRRRAGVRRQHVGRRARRLSADDQRQHRADPDDRDARRPEERRRDREGAGRDGGVRGQRRSRQLLGLPAGHRRTTSARSTSCTTPPSRPRCGCADRSRGAIVRTSPASRRAARRPRLRAA